MRLVETWRDQTVNAPLIVPKALSFEISPERVVIVYHNQDGSRFGNIVSSVTLRDVGAVSFDYLLPDPQRELTKVQIGDDLVLQKDSFSRNVGFDLYRAFKYLSNQEQSALVKFSGKLII